MANLENQLEQLVNEFGIENVMSSLVSKNRDKVFIPNWYYQHHIKSVFGKNIKLSKLNEKWADEGGYDYTNYSVVDIWQDIN